MGPVFFLTVLPEINELLLLLFVISSFKFLSEERYVLI